jgi:hypothetical protein
VGVFVLFRFGRFLREEIAPEFPNSHLLVCSRRLEESTEVQKEIRRGDIRR